MHKCAVCSLKKGKRKNEKGEVEHSMTLATILSRVAKQSSLTVAVAAAEDLETIEAVYEAVSREVSEFILFGNETTINELFRQYRPSLLNHKAVTVVHTQSVLEAAQLAVRSVQQGQAHIVMKGNLSTSLILKAVLNKEHGLRTGNVLSHVAVFDVPHYDSPILVTDAAMNITPSLEEKVQIIQNAVNVAHSIGIEVPKVAPIAAVEVVNPLMPATVEAALLTQMNRRGQIKGCVIDGPLALDNAINIEAAKQKGIQSEVAGQADILLVPAIETGNVLYKSLIYFAKAKVGAVLAGAKAPVVLTSRADSAESKLYSLALAISVAQQNS
ncbi:phosphate butyryltransferase [Priestia megaterium]|uniref:phosphate butyryltransferase n=1 Tax=Priestia megaterium TaxID=1404 RepID=UPI002159E45A|nr:phosphate butyryltransferase [Priestia megaterium]